MPPEEQSSLEEVERTARRRKAARRRPAREEKESTEAQDQPDSEPAIQEAHQATLDAGTRDGSVEEPPKGSERDSVSESLGVSNSDASTPGVSRRRCQVEPPAVDATSEAPQPLRSEFASPRLIQKDAQGPSPEVPQTSATQVVVNRTEAADPDAQVQVGEMTVAQAKAHVADQVRRWERVTLEFVASPTIEISWPSPVPEFRPWWAAVRATYEYLASRMSMANPNDAWISEWNLVPQSDPGMVSSARLSSGLEFRARGHPRYSAVAGCEAIEWRDLTSGVSSRIVPALSGQAPGDDVKFEESGMGVAMTDYEAGLLGRECLHGMRMAGVRPTLKPASSALGKPEPKRPHPIEASSGSGSDTEDRRNHRSSKHRSRSSKRQSKSKRPPSRSVKSEWTGRSERSVQSGMSGAPQVALNTMRSTQEALARMESTQSQQSESLHQAFQVIQALAAQASSTEERITQALEVQARTSEQNPTRATRISVAQPPATSTNIEDIREEEACLAQAHAQAELERRLQQRRSDVEAEQAAWAADLLQRLNAQMELFQEKIRALEEARNLDQATIRTLWNVQRIRSRNTPATSSGVQGTQATSGADSATSLKSVTGRSAMYPKSSGVITVCVSERRDRPISDLPVAQLQTTLPTLTGLTSDSSSSDDDLSDGDSNSLSGEAPVHAPLTTTPNGTTGMTFRPYVSSSTLEEFNEDASLPARRRWWERFLSLAVQSAWSGQTKVYELNSRCHPLCEIGVDSSPSTITKTGIGFPSCSSVSIANPSCPRLSAITL
ncbi:unnamed protein product [Phytophthora fragariaefolia]|uniref:Unnamed protein product n=1 Tax=Phytophthora fragariaefolia TaxID=1490495 RepID=A0A9W6U8W9_9STRA|nr:unnamed protein product [Phytophthora fragariaefolia]